MTNETSSISGNSTENNTTPGITKEQATDIATAVAQNRTNGGNVGSAIKAGLDATDLGQTNLGDVATHVPGLSDEAEALQESGLNVSDAAETAGAVAAMYSGQVNAQNIKTVANTAKKALPAAKKLIKKKTKKIIRRVIIVTVAIILLLAIFIGMLIIPPMIAATSYVSMLREQEEEQQQTVTLVDADGNEVEKEIEGLAGGIGVDYAALIEKYQAEYDAAEDDTAKNEAAGKIIYTQIFQLLDAESLETRHPMVLLGVACSCNEFGMFNTAPAALVEKNFDGNLRDGLYGIYTKRCLNGAPGNTNAHAGGQIGTNLGAKGLIQVECRNAIIYNLTSSGSLDILSTEVYNGKTNNITHIKKKAENAEADWMQYVDASNGHLTALKNSPNFTNLILSEVGHPTYISDYAAFTHTQSAFSANKGYMWPDRFVNEADYYNDFAAALDSPVSSYMMLTTYSIAGYPIDHFDELNGLIATNSSDLFEKAKNVFSYERNVTFVNQTSQEVYWTLCMLAGWNGGSPYCMQGGSDKNKAYDRSFVEIANFVGTYGMPALYDQCSGYVNVFAYTNKTDEAASTYNDFINFICKANKTDASSILDYLNEGSFVYNYKYAIKGLMNAYYWGQKQAVDILGLDSFDITNYGGTTKETSDTAGHAVGYHSNITWTGDTDKHPIRTDLPVGSTDEELIYYYTPTGEKRYIDSSGLGSMFDPALHHVITSQFAETQFHNYPGHSGVDTVAAGGYWLTYTIADCEVVSVSRYTIGGHGNYYQWNTDGTSSFLSSTKPSGFNDCGTSIKYVVLDDSGQRTNLYVQQLHLRPGSLDDINVGDRLPMGFCIGYASSTGSSTGNHSHTAFILLNQPDSIKPSGEMRINPAPFIQARCPNTTLGNRSGSVIPTFADECARNSK